MKKQYDVIVVGSGAGGGTITYEMATRGKSVLLIERGKEFRQDLAGDFWPVIFRYFDGFALRKSREGTVVYSTSNLGGTTVVSCGNMVRSLQQEFKSCGVDLEQEFQEAEEDLGVKPLPSGRIKAGSRVIMQAAQELGYNMVPMPKGFNSEGTCDLCGNCVVGCHKGSKWDARSYIDEALQSGMTIMCSTRVERVLFDENHVRGVQITDGKGKKEIECNKVILAAGGIGTPIILQKSNVSAGNGLFIDPFEITCGIGNAPRLTQLIGPAMAAVGDFHEQGFILSPFVDHWSQMLIFADLWWDFVHKLPQSRVLSIMTKIADSRISDEGKAWKVDPTGKISKTLTIRDRYRLDKGAAMSREILKQAGVDPRTIISTRRRARGAHPGGTAAIGEVVNSDLQVKGTQGLYVCDCSVFPDSPGAPPILTIVALAKWLAKRI